MLPDSQAVAEAEIASKQETQATNLQDAQAKAAAEPGNAAKARVASKRKSEALERQRPAKGKKAKAGPPDAVAQIANYSKSQVVFRRLQEQRT